MKASLVWDDIGEIHRGKYLTFEEEPFGYYTIANNDLLELGRIELVKIGAWSHWCLFLDKDCYLSPGCNDEVREMQRLLGLQSHKQKYAKGGKSE